MPTWVHSQFKQRASFVERYNREPWIESYEIAFNCWTHMVLKQFRPVRATPSRTAISVQGCGLLRQCALLPALIPLHLTLTLLAPIACWSNAENCYDSLTSAMAILHSPQAVLSMFVCWRKGRNGLDTVSAKLRAMKHQLTRNVIELDPHIYTTRRWLNNDRRHRDARHLEFDFVALCAKSVNVSSSATKVVCCERNKEGSTEYSFCE